MKPSKRAAVRTSSGPSPPALSSRAISEQPRSRASKWMPLLVWPQTPEDRSLTGGFSAWARVNQNPASLNRSSALRCAARSAEVVAVKILDPAFSFSERCCDPSSATSSWWIGPSSCTILSARSARSPDGDFGGSAKSWSGKRRADTPASDEQRLQGFPNLIGSTDAGTSAVTRSLFAPSIRIPSTAHSRAYSSAAFERATSTDRL